MLKFGETTRWCLAISVLAISTLRATFDDEPQQPFGGVTEHLALGTPTRRETILRREGYVVCYDEVRRMPVWTAYCLRPQYLVVAGGNRPSWVPDIDLPKEIRAESDDYTRSEYDRGHLVPFADMRRNPNTEFESMRLTNVAPQDPHLNRGRWAKLEERVRTNVDAGDVAFVFTGVLANWDAERISPRRLTIPTVWWKLICANKADEWRTMAVIHENAKDASPRIVSISDLEQRTGLELARQLPVQAERREMMLDLDDCTE